jgi:hypothetical protein
MSPSQWAPRSEKRNLLHWLSELSVMNMSQEIDRRMEETNFMVLLGFRASALYRLLLESCQITYSLFSQFPKHLH